MREEKEGEGVIHTDIFSSVTKQCVTHVDVASSKQRFHI